MPEWLVRSFYMSRTRTSRRGRGPKNQTNRSSAEVFEVTISGRNGLLKLPLQIKVVIRAVILDVIKCEVKMSGR